MQSPEIESFRGGLNESTVRDRNVRLPIQTRLVTARSPIRYRREQVAQILWEFIDSFEGRSAMPMRRYRGTCPRQNKFGGAHHEGETKSDIENDPPRCIGNAACERGPGGAGSAVIGSLSACAASAGWLTRRTSDLAGRKERGRCRQRRASRCLALRCNL